MENIAKYLWVTPSGALQCCCSPEARVISNVYVTVSKETATDAGASRDDMRRSMQWRDNFRARLPGAYCGCTMAGGTVASGPVVV